MTGRALISATCVALFMALPLSAQDVPEPDDYRDDHYRAPVPATLTGVTVVDDETAHALWQAGEVAFIDVVPQPPKPKNLPKGTIWREKPRHAIPGSLWLPNVGYGRIAEQTHSYFKQGLEKATGGDKAHPILIYCLMDCWMSWNAAKRAREYGYETVYWYPDGTDGWTFMEYPTEVLEREAEPTGD